MADVEEYVPAIQGRPPSGFFPSDNNGGDLLNADHEELMSPTRTLTSTSTSPQQPPLTLPRILRFLQFEWRKMEIERVEWSIEKEELQAKVTLMEGEKRGFEALKEDLVRRIQMLEKALKEERATKFQGTKQISVPSSANSEKTSAAGDLSLQTPVSINPSYAPTQPLPIRGPSKTREILKQYLKEVGYVGATTTDDLYLSNSSHEDFTNNNYSSTRRNHTLSGAPPLHGQENVNQNARSTTGKRGSYLSVAKIGLPGAEVPKVLKREPSDHTLSKPTKSTTKPLMKDMFVHSSDESFSTSVDEDRNNLEEIPESELIKSFTLSNQKTQKMMKNWEKMYAQNASTSSNSNIHPQSITLEDDDGSTATLLDDGQAVELKLPSDDSKQSEGEAKKKKKKKRKSGSAKTTIAQTKDPEEPFMDEVLAPIKPELDDELANLSVGEVESETKMKVEVAGVKVENHLWRPKFTLRSHYDSVRAAAFLPNELSVVTAAEDGCIKFWPMEGIASMKKPPQDIEPAITFRGHVGSVNALALSTLIPPSVDAELEVRLQYGLLFSGGMDKTIRLWGIPDNQLTPYSTYDYRKYNIAKFEGHTDAIWGLIYHPIRPFLGSCSADGTVKLWNMNSLESETGSQNDVINASDSLALTIAYDGPVDHTYTAHAGSPTPTSLEFLHTDNHQVAVSYSNSEIRIYDVESGKIITESFKGANSTYDQTTSTQINQIVAHKVMPVLVSAHEDRHIRYFDARAGECTHSMVAHLDSVSCLDISPNGLVIISGGHDSSIRLWDLQTHACLQEFSAHRKKYDEAIHVAQFHPQSNLSNNSASAGVSGASSWLLTGGADSCAKVYNFA